MPIALLTERADHRRWLVLDELARAARSGDDLSLALREAASDAPVPRSVRRALGRVAAAHASGTTVSAAVSAEEAIRTEAIVATLEAGERSGRLAEVLASLRDAQARSLHHSRRLMDAVLHPALTIAAALALLAFVLAIPAPRLVGLAGTRIAPAALTAFALVVAGVTVAIVLALSRRARERIPIVGAVASYLASPRRGGERAAQADALRVMLAAGVPEPEALELSARAIDADDDEARAIRGLAAAIRRGESVADAAAVDQAIDPLLVAALGRSGAAADCLARLARWREIEAERLAADVERVSAVAALLIAGATCALVLVVAWGGYFEIVTRIH